MQPLSYPSSPSLSRYLFFPLFVLHFNSPSLLYYFSLPLPFYLAFCLVFSSQDLSLCFLYFLPSSGSPINTQWKTAVAWLDYFSLYGISHNLTSKQNTSALQTNLKSRVNLTTREHVEEHCPGEKMFARVGDRRFILSVACFVCSPDFLSIVE